MWVQLVITLLTLVAAILQFVIAGQRSLIHKALLTALLFSAGLTGIGIYWTDHSNSEQQEESNKQIREAVTQRDEIQAKLIEAEKQRDEIQAELRQLRQTIEPLMKKAKNRYPHFSDEKALEKLASDVELLTEKTRHLEKSTTGILERQKPRKFTSAQEQLFLNALAGKPKTVVEIECPSGNNEPCRFATQIFQLLRKAGWSTKFAHASLINVPVGVRMAMRNPGDAPPSLETLNDAFVAVGVQPDYRYDKSLSSGIIRLRVGTKP